MIRLFLILPIFLFLHGCATISLTEEQKQSLSEVVVSPTTIVDDPYRIPDGTTSPNMGTTVPIATGGGLLPALIGLAIDSAITSAQKSKFEAKNAQHFDEIEKQMPKDIYESISQTVSNVFSQDSFFGNRIRPIATNILKSEILQYGLVRRQKTEDGDIKLGMVISVNIQLEDSSIENSSIESNDFEDNNETEYFAHLLLGTSESTYTISEYVQMPALLTDVVNEALNKLGNEFRTVLDTSLGREAETVALTDLEQ